MSLPECLHLKTLYAVDYRFKTGNPIDRLMKVITLAKQDVLKKQILDMITKRQSKVNQLI